MQEGRAPLAPPPMSIHMQLNVNKDKKDVFFKITSQKQSYKKVLLFHVEQKTTIKTMTKKTTIFYFYTFANKKPPRNFDF